MVEFGNTSRGCWVSKSRLKITQDTTITTITQFLNQHVFLGTLN
nr:MAG TPA: hypothetical protein [Caudoviricetes sp.]